MIESEMMDLSQTYTRTLTIASAIAPGVTLFIPHNAALLARVAREASAPPTELGEV